MQTIISKMDYPIASPVIIPVEPAVAQVKMTVRAVPLAMKMHLEKMHLKMDNVFANKIYLMTA